MIAVYADHRGIQQLIESQISDSDIVHRTTKDRRKFSRMMGEAQTGIVGTLECSAGLVRYLRSTFRLGDAAGPTCIVVTPVSFDNLRSLRDVECERLHVVWVEEVEKQLHQVLSRVAPSHRDPFRSLGPISSWASSLSPAMTSAVRLIRAISHDHSPPPISVSELAKQVNLDPRKLGYSWKTEMPLRCTPSQMLQWGVLLWAVGQRSGDTWAGIAHRAGLSLRTLQRYSLKLAQCRLDSVGHDPTLLRRQYEEWFASVMID